MIKLKRVVIYFKIFILKDIMNNIIALTGMTRNRPGSRAILAKSSASS